MGKPRKEDDFDIKSASGILDKFIEGMSDEEVSTLVDQAQEDEPEPTSHAAMNDLLRGPRGAVIYVEDEEPEGEGEGQQ